MLFFLLLSQFSNKIYYDQKKNKKHVYENTLLNVLYFLLFFINNTKNQQRYIFDRRFKILNFRYLGLSSYETAKRKKGFEISVHGIV